MAADALSPLDGRYAAQMRPFARAFSEDALFRQRFAVEVRWLLALSAEPGVAELPALGERLVEQLESWVRDFDAGDAERIREIERRTNHDVKAVEYYLKERLGSLGFSDGSEFVHFACTSEDINNIAHSLMIRDGLEHGWLPLAESLIGDVWSEAETHAGLAMLSHTHGQPASPTTLGKELAVFAARWRRQVQAVRAVPLMGKFNGAVGTFGAHVVAYPEVDWLALSRRFVESFDLEWNPVTTQIEPHDAMAEVFHCIVRFNSVLLDFARDMWEYVSRGYLTQRPVPGEVGSSTMPHKVNPIDFENAEANAGVSTALLEHLATKLPVSRMQRDLSDSSAIRNMGLGFGYSALAITSATRGLSKTSPDAAAIAGALDSQWEVLAEAVQTVMRRYGLPEPYERLKELTRGRALDRMDMQSFVKSLGLPPDAEARLLALTPAGYVGLAADIVGLARPVRPG